MSKGNHDAEDHEDKPSANGHADDAAAEDETGQETSGAVIATVATLGVVGVGVAVFEAALLPGVILGAAAMLAPKLMPQLGSALQPLFKSTVRGAYKITQKTREFMAETHEHVQDIVAEVDAEVEEKGAALADAAPAGARAAK